MTGGRVVRLRISPKDCIRVVDALKVMGTDPTKLNGALSFSHAVKKVLESCLLTLERDGIIPNRDGFEYLEMMQPFPDSAEAIKLRAAQIKFTNLESGPAHAAVPITEEPYERKQRRIQYDELALKWAVDRENMSEEQKELYFSLMPEFQNT